MWLELTTLQGEPTLVNMHHVVTITTEGDGSRLHVTLPESSAHSGVAVLVRETQADIRNKLVSGRT
jgi:hypothetical protein